MSAGIGTANAPASTNRVEVAAGNLGVEEVHRRRADEAGDEHVDRLVVQRLRRVELLQDAVAHDGDAGGHGHGFRLVVGHVDEGGLQPLVQFGNVGAGLHAQFGVEVGERLVEEKHLRLADDGAAEGHALALAAGELARLALEHVGQAEHFGRFLHAPVDFGPGNAAQLEAEGHVVVHGHVRVEGVGLEHHRDIAVFRGDVVHHPRVRS